VRAPRASLLLVALAAEAGVRLLAPRGRGPRSVPVDVRDHFSEQEIQRGASYARPQLALALARMAVELGALALTVRRPPRWLRDASDRPIASSAIAGAGLTVALSLAPLPLAAIARSRAIAAGLATQSWGGWAVDLLKETAIEAGLAAGAAGAATATSRRYPRGWWALGAIGSVTVGAGFAALAPVLFDPVFNDYEPLPEGELRSDMLELARMAGVRVGQVYSVDASRRTTAANAYVTGLGPTKRVVLFDTLIDRYDPDEIRVVVAHELAHVRHRDVVRSVAYSAIVAAPAAFAVQRLSWVLSPERGTPAALPALALASAVVAAPVGLIGGRLSRAIERRADAFSLDLTAAPEAFVSFERKIALQNVADLEPPLWVTRLMATHPPTAERIGIARAWQKQRGREAPS
jgi:STE24 endopeptidase